MIKIGNITDIHKNDEDTPYSGPDGPGDGDEYRVYSTASTRVVAAGATFESESVDVVTMLGDITDGGHADPGTGLASIITDLESEYSGDHYGILGNHDDHSTWAANIDNTTGSNDYATIWASGGVDYSFAFKIQELWFISIFNNTGADWTAQKSAIETFITNLAGAPYLVLAHEPFFDANDGMAMTEAAAAKTLFETYGNCQAVLSSHRHYPVDRITINGIQYVPLRGSLLSPTSDGAGNNSYDVIKIVPEAVYTSHGVKPNIEITNYGLGESKDYTKYLV